MFISVHIEPWVSIGVMTEKQGGERSVRELREGLADVLNAAAVRGEITYVTSRGRRIAAVVPVPVAEAAEQRREGPQT
jgi:prevent-host-death family protein